VSEDQPEPAIARRNAWSARVVLRVWGERLGVLLIVAGIAGLVQPFIQNYFTYGFSVLLVGTIIFIIASHL
jgi:hypothetical protein